MSDFASIQELWKTHLSKPFPRAMASKEFDGEDLAWIDSLASGCIYTFVNGGGAQSLDTKKLQVLDSCAQSLSRICPQLPDEHRGYFDALRNISERVVSYCREDLK